MIPLDFNSIQTWKDIELIYPMVTAGYNLEPVKPAVMAEGVEERGVEYGFEVTPLMDSQTGLLYISGRRAPQLWTSNIHILRMLCCFWKYEKKRGGISVAVSVSDSGIT